MAKKILITGSTDGIGLETAKQLAKLGCEILLHGRNGEKLEIAKREVQKQNENVKVETYLADFGDFGAVSQMAECILEKHDNIDVIINNAGVFVLNKNESLSKSGYDMRFAVNAISPFILTKKLLPILANDGRVVNLSSAAQAPINFSALKNGEIFSNDSGYAQSKLAITMWTMSLAQSALQNQVFVAVNPKSFLASKMVEKAYGMKGYDLKFGSDILVKSALSKEFEKGNGKYFDNDDEVFANPHPFATNVENRTELISFLESVE